MKSDSASTGAIVVLVNAASEEQAGSIATALVGERLAACVNIVSPIRSIYRWKDEVQVDTEHLMIIKTRADLVAKIEARVKSSTATRSPKSSRLPIAGGAKSYLDWLFASTTARLARGIGTDDRQSRDRRAAVEPGEHEEDGIGKK